jgi:hypothetical protein
MKGAAKALALAMSLSVVAGCYSFASVQSPQVGMDVRARLTSEAAVRRSQGLDDPVVRLDGTVVEATPTALSLDVLVARSSSAFQDVEIRDTVRLEKQEIQSIMVRKFSAPKTALFVVGAGAAIFGIVKGIDQVVGGTENGDGGGDPTTFTVPIFSWVGFRALRVGR